MNQQDIPSNQDASDSQNGMGDIATLHCGGFDLPVSSHMSEESQQILSQLALDQKAAQDKAAQGKNAGKNLSPPAIPSQEEQRETFYKTDAYQRLRTRYPVDIKLETLGGVTVEVITPTAGVSDEHKDRVIINFHGGSFQSGSRISSQQESIPIAALGRIKVISVDYRMYPEHSYPAASEDTVAAYKALLESYPSTHIGMLGTSSGGALCAQTLVQLQKQQLPLPCAVAMIACGAAKREGDSVAIGSSIFEAQVGCNLDMTLGYYEGVDMSDPEVTPANSDQYMAAFPPTFLASSTRDFLLSSVLATHRELLQLDVEAELHVWEGLGHFFHSNIDLPETEELHRQTLEFFKKHFM